MNKHNCDFFGLRLPQQRLLGFFVKSAEGVKEVACFRASGLGFKVAYLYFHIVPSLSEWNCIFMHIFNKPTSGAWGPASKTDHFLTSSSHSSE